MSNDPGLRPDAQPLPDLTQELAQRLRVSTDIAKLTLETTCKAIRDALLSGNEVKLDGVGALRIGEQAAQVVKHPESGRQSLSPARRVVVFETSPELASQLAHAKLATIVVVLAPEDPFADVVDHHFSRAGWRVDSVHTRQQCLDHIDTKGCNLIVVDQSLPEATHLIRELKCSRRAGAIPIIALLPHDGPGASDGLEVIADEELVEPFEIYTLLMLVESELARVGSQTRSVVQDLASRFRSTQSNLEAGAQLAESLCASAGLSEESQVALVYAIREGLANAVQHGNTYNPKKQVTFTYCLQPDRIEVVITDEGLGFDHARQIASSRTKSAVTAARDRHAQGQFGGLGIMLMHKCVDVVNYNSSGNELTLIKHLPTAANAKRRL